MYEIQLWYRDQDGKPVNLRRRADCSEVQAFEIYHELRSAAKAGTIHKLLEPDSMIEQQPDCEMTFKEFGEHWLATYVDANCKPSVQRKRRSVFSQHLYPKFGEYHLADIWPDAIEAYKRDKQNQEKRSANEKLAGKGRLGNYAPKTINNHLAILKTLFNCAVQWGYLEHSPMEGVKKLRIGKNAAPFRYYSPEKLAAFLAAIAEHYPKRFMLFLVASRTGMRQGELLALHWSDIDFEAKEILVRRNYSEGQFVTPKSGNSRVIPIDTETSDFLKEYRLSNMDCELVFTNRQGGVLNPKTLNRPLFGAQKKAGLPRLVFHGLRHTAASIMVNTGKSLKAAQEILGHASITTTEGYLHVDDSVKRDAANAVGEAMSRIEQAMDLDESDSSVPAIEADNVVDAKELFGSRDLYNECTTQTKKA